MSLPKPSVGAWRRAEEEGPVAVPELRAARMTVDQAAHVLGFSSDSIRILIAVGVLRALGTPRRGAQKYLATAYVNNLRTDLEWLGKATDVVAEHIAAKNAARLRRKGAPTKRGNEAVSKS